MGNKPSPKQKFPEYANKKLDVVEEALKKRFPNTRIRVQRPTSSPLAKHQEFDRIIINVDENDIVSSQYPPSCQ